MAWSNESKSSSSFTAEEMNSGLFFLLQEIGDYLLQENGYPILLDQSIDWGDGTLNTSSFTNQIKN